MKTLFLVALLGAGLWLLFTRAKRNQAVKDVQQAPERYVRSLQKDAARAQQVQSAANQAIEARDRAVQQAIDADR